MLDDHTGHVYDDWCDATGDDKTGECRFRENYDRIRAARFTGKTHLRIIASPEFYPVECDEHYASLMAAAVARCSLSETLEIEIASPAQSHAAVRL